MTPRPLILLATAGLLALAACGPLNTSSGELNNGRFSYLCVDSSDAACDDFVGSVSLPALIAVGGAFDIQYTGESVDGAPVQVVPASDKMMTGSSGSFRLLRPGVSAALARSNSGSVADFVHLQGALIDHLDVAGPSSTTAVTKVAMDTDKGVDLQVTPKDALGTSLAGAFSYAWTTSDATILSLDAQDRRNRVHLTAFKPGKVTVEASLPGGAKQAVVVTVTQGTNTGTSSGGGGAGSSGSSSGTGSSSGAGGAGGGQ
jgi:hypothetical protein